MITKIEHVHEKSSLWSLWWAVLERRLPKNRHDGAPRAGDQHTESPPCPFLYLPPSVSWSMVSCILRYFVFFSRGSATLLAAAALIPRGAYPVRAPRSNCTNPAFKAAGPREIEKPQHLIPYANEFAS